MGQIVDAFPFQALFASASIFPTEKKRERKMSFNLSCNFFMY